MCEERPAVLVATGKSGKLPHSAQAPSYTDTQVLPIRCSASASTQAVMPDPQLQIVVAFGLTPASSKA